MRPGEGEGGQGGRAGIGVMVARALFDSLCSSQRQRRGRVLCWGIVETGPSIDRLSA